MSVSRNAIYNLGGHLTPVVITLVSVPLFIKLLGEARYGALVLVWLMTGFLLFLDFGVGLAVRYEIARRRDASEDERELVFWTGIILSLAFGLVGAAIMYPVAWLVFGHIVSVPDQIRAELLGVLPWIPLGMPLATLDGVLTGSLMGREKFLTLNVRKVMGTSMEQLAPLLAVIFIEPTLSVAVPASIIGKTASISLLVLVAFRSMPARFRPRYSGSKLAKTMLGYGLWSSAGTFGQQLLNNADRFVISSVLGTVQVAFYNVPSALLQRAQLFPRALVEAIFPRVAQTDAAGFIRIADRATRANLAMSCVLSAGAIVIMQPFLTIWINADFASRATSVGQILAFSTTLLAAGSVPTILLQSSGRPREATTILLLELLPFLGLLWLGSQYMGIAGAAIVLCLRAASDYLLLSWRAGTLRLSLPCLAQAVALLFAVLGVTLIFPDLTPVAIAAKLAMLALTMGWALWLSPELRKMALNVPLRLVGGRRSGTPNR